MINLAAGLLLIAFIVWTAKKFYFPTRMADHPDRYPPMRIQGVTKRQLTTTLDQIQRWRQEGKITREEYDRLTDICLAELKQLEHDEPKE